MLADLGDITVDERLLEAIKRDDRNAFEQLFRKYYEAMCRYAATYLENKEEVEDVAQDVFIYLWNHRKEIVLQSALRSYLFSCVKHRVLNLLKHRAVERNHSRLLAEFWEDLSKEEYSEEEQLRLEQIQRILQDLPPQCYTVFMKSCLESKKYKEIAEELDISVNTVKYHILRAYRQLRENVQPIENITTFLFIVCMNQRFKNKNI